MDNSTSTEQVVETNQPETAIEGVPVVETTETNVGISANVPNVDVEELFNSMSDEEFARGDWKTQTTDVSTSIDGVPVSTANEQHVPDTQQAESNNDETQPEDNKTQEQVDNQTDADKAILHKQLVDALLGSKIKGGGAEVQFDNVEDILSAVQKGLGYTQRMQQLKPHRATIDLLEANNLLEDQEALPRMIEAFVGNKEAIMDLVKKHGITTEDLGVESDLEYTPNIRSRTESELELKDTIAELKSNDNYTAVDKAYNLFTENESSEEKSDTILTSNPKLLSALSDDILDGSYQKVMDKLSSERAMGKLDPTISNVSHYGRMHVEMFSSQQAPSTVPPVTVPNSVVPNKVVPPVVNPLSRTSTSVVPTNPTTAPLVSDIQSAIDNMAGLSDEEWTKLYGKK